MILLLLRLLSVAGVVFIFLKRKQAPRQAWFASLVLLVLVAVTVTAQIVRSRRPVNASLFRITGLVNEASGYHLGQVIADEVPPNSTLLVLHNDPSVELFDLVKERVMWGVRAGLDGRDYNWHFSYQAIPPHQRDDEEVLVEASRLSAERLGEALRTYPEVDAVLSLVGRPLLNTRKAESLKLPPFYLHLTDRDSNLESQIQQGLVRAAVVYRESPDWSTLPAAGMSMEEIFTLRYKLLQSGK